MARFYSHGKLLLTGEYAVLDGALALSLPTRYGQSMEVQHREKPGISWTSLEADGGIWYKGDFDQDAVPSTKYPEDPAYEGTGKRLARILVAAKEILAKEAAFAFHHNITTRLEFPREWGLGSSSTLIHNLADWMGVDPYELLFNTMGGSGYDIACAAADGPILYQLTDRSPSITRVEFDPPFKDSLCFVYLGRKQLSSEAITHYRQAVTKAPEFISKISSLTKEVLACNQLEDFEQLLEAHEALLSGVLDLPRVQEHFSDYPGVLKSLGAWGGDFILATRAEAAADYFKKKGLTPVIPFSEMIL